MAIPLVPALSCFIVGVGMAVAVALFSYLSQGCFSISNNRPKYTKLGHAFKWVAIGVGVLSFAAFFTGGAISMDAFSSSGGAH